MVEFQGRAVEMADIVKTAAPGYAVDCVRCDRELVVAARTDVPVVCPACYAQILALREAAQATGLRFGV